MATTRVTRATRATRLRSGTALLGPAFVAAIAYVDPGNVATNTAAGARYGFLLVWVLVAANVMAGLVQTLSAKLGLVTGCSLPEAVRDGLSRPARLAYWAQAEGVAAATDLAEVVGGAIALNLLFDLPLLLGGVITGVVSTVLLVLRDRGGQRAFERVITGMLLVIAIGFAAGLLLSPPPAEALGGLVPRFDGVDSVVLAAGMLGATVMPHAVYVHSALARDRHGRTTGDALRRLLAATRVDVVLAMVVAGAVNLALLLLAATALRDVPGLDGLDQVHAAIGDALGGGVALLFAVGLLASGLASTAVGSYSGAVVLEGLLDVRVSPLTRRLVTLAPALLVLAVGVDPTRALVWSQVVLSFGIPFALAPLVRLTSSRAVMGEHVNGRGTVVAAWGAAVAVIALNAVLLVLLAIG
ncbi:Nramp family divalent metal transporter [Actinosynnema sp.]|uniref:Nramp family divalent metal transporter n=1 Tax=Actinosynnema sp. TaxID=1872144 RepID=UPI003F871535